ncbi:DNA/RNA nuclease SfsA [Aquisalinus flavus]|uniref:Sugar fermentation stimulation protein homolog n=1 Tax=Aquisalinus flavus TaxID=1526572 RepID=A0A8J2Y5D6_9PROT|nr:DNA/RNA nuclease SfsA [Aquisalinus flavus]MBD0426870.1 DNA/RNA nuclease SfsA [Aquisalinus flavus]UNE46717.1 DNA/RNA nuclease SfsA [Aquisalinus flavus]GGC96619.1 sugar fermentation stimulation protein [Aquisalinus flavus]
MRFPSPLIEGTLLKRYKRFLADVRLATGEDVTVHCPNPGAMTGVAATGARCWVSVSPNRARKLAHTLELVEITDYGRPILTGINTGHPNRIAEEAIAKGAVPELAGYDSLRREVKYGGNSRIDLLLESARRKPCYVEVKNVHLRRSQAPLAEFPDSVTARGLKHLKELEQVVRDGNRAVMFYVVQRSDCFTLSPAWDIDPKYADGLVAAQRAGVELIAWDCEVTTGEIVLRRAMEIDLNR